MNEMLTIDEIKARYPSEHVLLADPQTNEQNQILGGRVVCHNQDMEELCREGIKSRPINFAVVYTGPMPEHVALNL